MTLTREELVELEERSRLSRRVIENLEKLSLPMEDFRKEIRAALNET